MAVKTVKETATSTSPKQTTLTDEWRLADAQKEINDAFRAGDMKTYLRKKERLIVMLGETRRIVRRMYQNDLSIEQIIHCVGANTLADLAVMLVLDPLFEVDHYLGY